MFQRRIYSFICVLFGSLLLPLCVSAQKKHIEGEEQKDSIPLFRGVQVSYDLAGTILMMVNTYGQYEAQARINLKDKFFPVIEAGYGAGDHPTDAVTGIHAKAKAPYFRIGMDYNIMKNKHDVYRLYFGGRYAFTSYSFDCDAIATDPVWGTKSPYIIHETGLSYHWAELAFTVDAKIWGPVRMGWSFRYKIPIAGNEGNSGSLWYIPGFGEYGNKLNGTFVIGVEL